MNFGRVYGNPVKSVFVNKCMVSGRTVLDYQRIGFSAL
jgi:hypothetical protein